MTDLEKEYQTQVKLLEWLDQRFSRAFKNVGNSRVYLTCYELCIEHHAAILILFTNQLRGSMFALIRVQLESLVRGQYLHYCATEREWGKFLNYKEIGISLGDMIDAVEKQIDEKSKVLSKLKNASYKTFCGFTHTGFEQITRRNKDGFVGSVNYPDSETIQILRVSGSLALFAFCGLAEIAEDEAFTSELLAYIELYSKS